MNISFYTDNIDTRIPEMQKRVFEKLGLEINQIKPKVWEGHGGSINTWLIENYEKIQNEIIILWDIDCIPLHKEIVDEAIRFAKQGGIMGVAQKASHIPNSIIYASPAFVAFSISTLKELRYPPMYCTERADACAELTYKAREYGKEVRLLYPTHVEEPLWQLDGSIMFGKGTTYGNAIYHAFYSRKGNIEPFIKKCKEILDL